MNELEFIELNKFFDKEILKVLVSIFDEEGMIVFYCVV